MTTPFARYVHGDVQTLTYSTLLTGTAITAGDVLNVGNLVLVAHASVALGDVAELAYEGGGYDVTKDPAVNFTQGDDVFVDFSTGLAVKTPNANTRRFGSCEMTSGTNATSVRATHDQSANSNTVNRAAGASTAAAGSTTADAGVLPAGTAPVYPTTAADDTKGVRVHASDKVSGRLIMIGNGVSNKILKVYPPTGGTINGAAADAAFSSASGKGVQMYCLDATANTWLAW